MNKLLPVCFFLLLAYFNKTNIYGFIILSIALGAFYKDKRASLVLVLVWLTIIASKREHFQTEAEAGTITNNTVNKPNNIVSVSATIEGLKTPISLEVFPENTFVDLKKQLESLANKDLTLFRLGIELKSETFLKKQYFIPLNEESASIKNWNRNKQTLNETAKNFIDGLGVEKLKTNLENQDPETLRFNFINKYQFPDIITNFNVVLKKLINRERLYFIFRNLSLVSDETQIENILIEENIETPDQLIKISKQKYDQTSIDLSTITVRLNATDIEQLNTFGHIFPIYGFEENRIIRFIKRNPALRAVSKEEIIKALEPLIPEMTSLEKESYDYYIGKKTLHPKYFKLLEELKLNVLFGLETIDEVLRIANVETTKDLYYISILFSMNNVLTEVDLNDETDGWKLRGLQKLSQRYSSMFSDVDPVLNRYNLRQRITDLLYDFKINLDQTLTKDFDSVNLSDSLGQLKQFKNKIYENEVNKQRNIEFKKIGEINSAANIYEQQRNQNPELIEINKIEREFSNVFLDIVNELTDLFSYKGDESFQNYIEFSEMEIVPDSNPFMFHKYIFYFKNLAIILTKDGRMFYVGMLFLVVAFLLYFIEASK